jgi:IclR family pca regulon transcriptional regulator
VVEPNAVIEPSAEPEPDGSAYVQSLARGLAVIRAFGPDRPRMPLAEIARATGLSRATARRFLLTLETLGYVRGADGVFTLTPRVLELGFSYLSALSLPEVAQPHLEALSQTVGESTSASVLDGADIVYVARVPTRRIMSVGITIGTRFPAAVTSMGRVLLAALPDGERDALLAANPVPARTPRTRTDAGELRVELARVREQGWSLVDQELEDGIRSIAAPVTRAARVVAAINISTTAGSGSLDEVRERLLEPLLTTARAISAELEHLPR